MQVDQTMPDGKWEFDKGVTDVFDDMLSRSIPQYEVMRKACFDLASAYVKPNTDIVDLGCSRGEAMAMLVDRFGAHNRFVGVEVSDPMLEAARERFEGLTRCGVMKLSRLDLRREYPAVRASMTLCVLTLQFTPIEYRHQILRRIYEHTNPGGAMILVEKVLGAEAETDELMVRTYLQMKQANGYSQDQIDRKRMALEGVLVPVTAKWNEDMLQAAGFSKVECFWRWMNFAGWLAVK